MVRFDNPAVLIVVLLLALIAVGCGGESEEDEFKDDYQPLNRELLEVGEELGSAVENAEGKTDQEIQRQFGGLADDLEQIERKLSDLDPPDDLADDTSELSSAIEDTVDSLRDIESAATSGDAKAAETATVKLLRTDSPKVNEAQNRLAEATGAEKGAR